MDRLALSFAATSFVFVTLCAVAAVSFELDASYHPATVPKLDGVTKHSLAGSQWQLSSSSGRVVDIPATVPGTVHTDLQKASVIDNPYYRDNDVEYHWIALEDWTYRSAFHLSENDLEADCDVRLVAEGLDTISRVKVNGQLVGTSENQFQRYVFTLKGIAVAGKNTIEITFESPIHYAAAKEVEYPYPVPVGDSIGGDTNRQYIRKEQCSFGWDWGPSFPTSGIWKDIYVLTFTELATLDLVATPSYNDGLWTVESHMSALTDSSDLFDHDLADKLKATCTLTSVATGQSLGPFTSDVQAKAKAVGGSDALLSFSFSLPEGDIHRWWPNGYGDQPMYKLEVSLGAGEDQAISASTKIAFRTLSVVQEPVPGQEGLTFYFKVNEIAVFAKGANWIPADLFEPSIPEDEIRYLLRSTSGAHMNILRNWGGGIYQSDLFYDIADEEGIMIWQDFMFACSLYPRDTEFLENVRGEVLYQTHRMKSHPSIVVWSGNNENEGAIHWYTESQNNPFLYVVDYSVLYFDTVRTAILETDSSRPFIGSSPTNGDMSMDPYVGRWGDVGDERYGDVHYYNYGDLCVDVNTFPNPRFCSEYGFQSFPLRQTWQSVTVEGDWQYDSPMMQHREHHPNGIEELMAMAQQLFSFDQDKFSVTDGSTFQLWNVLTQWVQASCISAESEHYRRQRDTVMTMGAMYWQLNDIWEAPSWASIDKKGRWKVLHNHAVEFFSPMRVSAWLDPITDIQNATLNAHVASDSDRSVTGSVRITIYHWQKADPLKQWTSDFTVAARAGVTVYSKKVPTFIKEHISSTGAPSDYFVRFEGIDAGNVFSETSAPLAGLYRDSSLSPKSNCKRSLSFNGRSKGSHDSIDFTFSSDCHEPFVTFTVEDEEIVGHFSRNGYQHVAGEEDHVTFVSRKPLSDAQVEKLQKTVSFYSLLDLPM